MPLRLFSGRRLASFEQEAERAELVGGAVISPFEVAHPVDERGPSCRGCRDDARKPSSHIGDIDLCTLQF